MSLLEDDVDEDDNAWNRREAARMKQIQIGKARPEYQRYIREVPLSQRRPSQPSTPDPSARVSKRQFDRALADWRRLLHDYDIVPRVPPHGKNYQDDSEVPRARQNRFMKDAAGGESRYADQDESRNSPPTYSRTSRRYRGERSIGKFGPRKSANDTMEDDFDTTQVPAELEEAPVGPGAPPGGAVRISLADQLWEMPYQATVESQVMANAPACAWPWYDESVWNNAETPKKMLEMQQQYMLMETPDKLMMPFHGMDTMQHACFGGLANVDESSVTMGMDMGMDSCIVPHKLFDIAPVPEIPERCQVETLSTQHEEELAEDGEPMLKSSNDSDGELSPRPASSPAEMLSLRSPSLQLQSPSVSCLASPVPRTPKRQHYVPDTPSPSRMHFSWMHPCPTQSVNPWQLSAAAFSSYQVMPPEFLQGQAMPYS